VAQLQGAPGWRAIDFISDLHLQPSEPQTVEAWRSYLARSTADAIFILGDLFEVWVGDDALDEPGSFEAECAAVLHEAAQQRPLFFMVGNRDFLAGDEFLRRSGMTGLSDPTVLRWAGPASAQPWRCAVPGRCGVPAIPRCFALRRLAAATAGPAPGRAPRDRQIGTQRKRAAQASGAPYADADTQMNATWMQAAQAPWLIHGHTHQPADHALGNDQWRIVLSDWHIDADTRRAEVLRVTPEGWQRMPPDLA
jgi:UDP-2,3-diacylglucosamine hydrolase